MKYVLIALAFASLFSFCNGAPFKEVKDSSILVPVGRHVKPSIDSSTLITLFITYGKSPKGGYFSGHPAISRDGKVDLTLLRQDSAFNQSDGVLNGVRYTYGSGRDSMSTLKDINFGTDPE